MGNDVVPGEAIEGFPAFANAPCLKSANGQALTQLASILVELGGSADAQTIEWISFAENVICPAACAWVFPTLGAMPNNKGAVAEGKANLLAALEHLNAALATKTFLVGERPSSADAAVVASLNLAFKQVLSEEYRKNLPHVTRWFQTCVNQPEFNSFGKTQLCDKEAQFDAKTFGEVNKKGKDNKKAAAPKKEKAKAESKPKAEKRRRSLNPLPLPKPAMLPLKRRTPGPTSAASTTWTPGRGATPTTTPSPWPWTTSGRRWTRRTTRAGSESTSTAMRSPCPSWPRT